MKDANMPGSVNDANDFGSGPSAGDNVRNTNGHSRGGRNGSSHSANGQMNHVAKYDPRNGRHPASKPPIDAWFVMEILLSRWKRVVYTGLILAALGWVVGMLAWKKTYTATAQMLRFEPMAQGDFFKPQPISSDTFASIMKSPELLKRVAQQLNPPISPELLGKSVLIKADADSDMVKVLVKAYSKQWAVDTANLYASNAVQFTRDLQRDAVMALDKSLLLDRVTKMNTDLGALEKQFRALPQSELLMGKLNQLTGAATNLSHQLQMPAVSFSTTSRLTQQLLAAEDELAKLEAKYTDQYPAVVRRKAEIIELQNQLAHSTNSPGGLGTLPGNQLINPDYDIIHTKMQALANSRQLLADRQQEADALIKDPPGNVRFFAPATIKEITPDHRWLKVGLLMVFFGGLGIAFTLGQVFLVEFMDSRLKTASDVERVTKLPVIATLDNLDDKSPTAREQWAFRTWTMLQGRLSPSPNHGLVCGITSSKAGEGRSTWINLLADAASLSGFRVLTIATRPANGEGSVPREMPNGHVDEPETESTALALTTNALACPSEVAQQLTGPNARPSVHIPLPGWVWNLERRKQWQEALKHWRSIENVVILVELPPGSVPESVLLGENVPNIVWLTESGQAEAGETREQLETLRHARCNLVGAVLNREPALPLKNRFPRWLGSFALLLFTLVAFSANAQDKPLAPAPAYEIDTNHSSTNSITSNNSIASSNSIISSNSIASTTASFSVTSFNQAGDWLKHLTLGPGDVLNISLFGDPDTTHPDVLIGPDGRISFLEAQNIMAQGLTVDELRTNLNNELGKYRREPAVVISPVAYRSKRYFMMGRVVQRGVYVLDRPITVVEAVARAKGFETGLSGRNTLELADFERCFLMRHGQRIPLNFEDLFVRGDLSQNINVEPDDYFYFPPATIKQIYVLGEVRTPGVVPYTHNITIVSALAQRGGFTDVAYKTHVLVLRGSFSHPKGFIVDTEDIVYGRAKNFPLQPNDIVYVSGRPFLRVEQLADLALSAFLQSMTTEVAGKVMSTSKVNFQ
ncbi:MAG TPA: polysaccharide biosynthesis/export family protein [Verrucomicrobiae bacterium]|nr:polysaccharide biosynthesis/export family protein [Verrucomicrobiae bacterium]